jgi:hypothetical protein
MNTLIKASRFLLKEMIPIILGILIALFVNKQVDQNKQEQYLEKVMSSIRSEFSENVVELEAHIKEHNTFIAILEEHIGSDSLSLGEILNTTHGIQLVGIKNTTAQTLLNSNIHLTDFEKLSPLVDIQEGKTQLKLIEQELMRKIYSSLGSHDDIDKQVLRSIMNDMVFAEEFLLELHQEFNELK